MLSSLSIRLSPFSGPLHFGYCQTTVLGVGLGVDSTFAWDNNNNNDNDNKNNDKNNPHLNFKKGTVLGDKDQVVGIRDIG